jgi:O-antigen ligase
MRIVKKYLLAENTYCFLIAALLISILFPYAFSTTISILLFAASLFSSFYHKIEFKKSMLIPILMFLLMTISLLWSIDVDKSIRGLERQLFFLLIPISFILMPNLNRTTFLKALYYFSISIGGMFLLFLIYSTFRYFSKDDIGVYFYHSLVVLFDLNAIYVSTLVSISMLYMIFYRKKTLFHIVLIVLLAGFLVMLSSKNIIAVSIIALMLGWGLIKKLNLKTGLILGVAGLVIASLLFYSPIKQRWQQEFGSDLQEVFTCEGFHIFYPWTGTTLRLFQARVFYELMDENDVFFSGFGINAVQGKIAEKQEHYQLYCGYNTYDFHNQYIQTFSELGVVGFILLTFLLIILIRDYWKHKELMNLFFFIIMASVFVTESYLWRQRGMIFFLVIYCLLIKARPYLDLNKHKE